uniref:Uncharacterized protein n=1 Tax=Palpitomonas bilix TaxID=652834 RepID=A0A7S3GEK7_9EUKA
MALSKKSLPHILSISNKFGIDLLHLSDTELKILLNVDNMGGVKKEADEMLRIVESHCHKIERGESLPTCLRTTASLSAFLSGRVEKEVGNDQDVVAAAYWASKLPSCKSSEWRCRLGKAWTWLERTHTIWSKLEEKVRKVLDEASADTFSAMSNALSELKASSVMNDNLKTCLEEKIRECAQQALGDVCLCCKQRAAELRFYPCQHLCMCMNCSFNILQIKEDVNCLNTMGYYHVKDGGSPLVCLQCKSAAQMLSVHRSRSANSTQHAIK